VWLALVLLIACATPGCRRNAAEQASDPLSTDRIVASSDAGRNTTGTEPGMPRTPPVALEALPPRDPVRKIVLLSIDTLRPDVLSPYRSDLDTTPNLRRFAEEALLFTDVIAQAGSTAISHKSLFTSLYPSIHKTTRRRVPLALLELPMETLQSNGFRTAGFVGGGQVSAKLGFARGFDSYQEIRDLHQLGDQAVAWLNEHHADAFFLFLHTYQMHCPYTPPEEYRRKYADWYAGDIDPKGRVRKGQAGCGLSYYNHRSMSPDDYRYLRSLYDADAEFVDTFLGRIFDALRKLDVYDETMIVFTSDHGESFGEHGFVGHNRVYNTVLRVPLIVKIPGVPPSRLEAPVEMFDIMPTILEAAGIPPPYRLQGRSLLSLAAMSPDSAAREIRISEGSSVAVQEGDWKIVFRWDSEKRPRLFHLPTDPEERNDLSKEHPERVARLRDHHTRMRERNRELAAAFSFEAGNQAKIDEELTEHLRALGYVD
jgi:arylsulfatase A-like enzyme